MRCQCETCGSRYDDARASTLCPHLPLMSDDDLAQKDAGLKLMGKVVRFAHQAETGPDYTVMAVYWNGMVGLRDLPGEFAPHLFVVMGGAPK